MKANQLSLLIKDRKTRGVGGDPPPQIFLDQVIQGPLNIWTEHSNCQIHSRGDSKILIALLIPNIFLNSFYEIIFLCF